MNAIADRHNRSATPYVREAIPKDLIPKVEGTEPTIVFKRKIRRAFEFTDKDGSGAIDRKEFSDIMSLLQVHLSKMDLLNIFGYIDTDGSGTIDLGELEKFLEIRFPSRALIRCEMGLNIHKPYRFLKYHTWRVEARPLSFTLRPGPNSFGAFFHTSTNPSMVSDLKLGSKVIYINSARVERNRYIDIVHMLDNVPVPFFVVFEHVDNIRKTKIQDSLGNFLPINYEAKKTPLTSEEKKLFISYGTTLTNLGKAEEETEKNIYQYYNHCEHCPSEDAWYLAIHLFMEDESFSSASAVMAYFIMSLIALSTFTYIFQTLPDWEQWRGWHLLEGVVSILFTIEFVLRLASCRHIVKYMQDAMNIIDFCAIIPYWIEVFTTGLNTNVLRVVRVVRLLRLIRLAKTGSVQDILHIYKHTVFSTIHWMVIFILLGSVVLICIASCEFVFEVGTPTVTVVCDEMAFETNCNITDSTILDDEFYVGSNSSCRTTCEDFSHTGCCVFDQWTGSCQLWSSTEVLARENASTSSALCHLEEHRLRVDGTDTPFYSVTNSFWWVYVSMLVVGYGDIYAITELGRIVSSIAVCLGLMFLALPVIIVGFHFTLTQLTQRYSKLTPVIDAILEAAHRGTVIQLLEQVNEDIGTSLFTPHDVIVFLMNDSQINSKYKLEQILRYENGWAYLPHSYDHTPSLPRVSQFKLFVLFSLFGRKFQHERSAQKRKDRQFLRALKALERELLNTSATVGQINAHRRVKRDTNEAISNIDSEIRSLPISSSFGFKRYFSSGSMSSSLRRGVSIKFTGISSRDSVSGEDYRTPRKLEEFFQPSAGGTGQSDFSESNPAHKSSKQRKEIVRQKNSSSNRQENINEEARKELLSSSERKTRGVQVDQASARLKGKQKKISLAGKFGEDVVEPTRGIKRRL